MSYKLVLVVKRKRAVNHDSTKGYYDVEQVGELTFSDKATAQSIGMQLVEQHIVDDCTLMEE
jgi:hypothetical protein